MTGTSDPKSERALMFTPFRRDAPAAELLLRQAGIGAVICFDAGDLLRHLEQGANAALVTEEGFGRDIIDWLVQWVKHPRGSIGVVSVIDLLGFRLLFVLRFMVSSSCGSRAQAAAFSC